MLSLKTLLLLSWNHKMVLQHTSFNLWPFPVVVGSHGVSVPGEHEQGGGAQFRGLRYQHHPRHPARQVYKGIDLKLESISYYFRLTVQLSSRPIIQSSKCPIVQLSNHPIVQPSNCLTARLFSMYNGEILLGGFLLGLFYHLWAVPYHNLLTGITKLFKLT